MAKNRLEDSLVYILHHSKFELYGNLLTVTNAKKKNSTEILCFTIIHSSVTIF